MPGLQSPADVCAWYVRDADTDASHVLCPDCITRFIGTATVYPMSSEVLGPARSCSCCDADLSPPNATIDTPFAALPPAPTDDGDAETE